MWGSTRISRIVEVTAAYTSTIRPRVQGRGSSTPGRRRRCQAFRGVVHKRPRLCASGTPSGPSLGQGNPEAGSGQRADFDSGERLVPAGERSARSGEPPVPVRRPDFGSVRALVPAGRRPVPVHGPPVPAGRRSLRSGEPLAPVGRDAGASRGATPIGQSCLDRALRPFQSRNDRFFCRAAVAVRV